MTMLAGIAGLGPMGRAIGERLRAAGVRVVGYDADVQAAATSGLRTVSSSARLAQECEVTLVAAGGELAVALVGELAGNAAGGQLKSIVLCGVLDPRQVQTLAQATAATEIDLVDAPLDGGADALQSIGAVIFASGARDVVDSCAPLFQACGRWIYVGAAGCGQVVRMVNSLVRWANIMALADAFALAEALGANAAAVREAVLESSGASRALETWGQGWTAPGDELAQAAALAQEAGVALSFLQVLPKLAASLDLGRLQSLFNVGIADLSQQPAEGSTDEASEAIEALEPEAEGQQEPAVETSPLS